MARTDLANRDALARLSSANPVLVDIRPAADVVPGFTKNLILTSGPPLSWEHYTGGQRSAIIGGALFEGLAQTAQEADALIAAGKIRLSVCSEFGCVGSLAGIYTASMPVLVVKNTTVGNTAFCNLYEGTNPRRLNYGVYDEGVRERLLFVHSVVAPVVGEAVRAKGGIPLNPIMQRALHMGDELHSRNTAASLLFSREIFPQLLHQASGNVEAVEGAVNALTADHYFFLRLSMAAAKATADAAHGIEGSSIVTAMSFNCREFAIKVSCLGDRWITGPLPLVQAKLFEGHTEDEIAWMGGESIIIETIGLGALAQAAAFPLQTYQGGSPEAMIRNNLTMYDICIGEHPFFKIPYFGYRGVPAGIDLRRVVEKRITPLMNIGIAGRNGGQIGAGVVRAHPGCFETAFAAGQWD